MFICCWYSGIITPLFRANPPEIDIIQASRSQVTASRATCTSHHQLKVNNKLERPDTGPNRPNRGRTAGIGRVGVGGNAADNAMRAVQGKPAYVPGNLEF